MKKIYQAPALEIELYRLDANIAGNCATVVDMGPDSAGYIKVCDSYYEESGEPKPDEVSLFSLPSNVSFWDSCDCYTTASGEFFTS